MIETEESIVCWWVFVSLRAIIELQTYDILICFAIESMGKHRHHKHIDHERDKQRDCSFNEEIEIGITDFSRLSSIHIARLKQNRHSWLDYAYHVLAALLWLTFTNAECK